MSKILSVAKFVASLWEAYKQEMSVVLARERVLN